MTVLRGDMNVNVHAVEDKKRTHWDASGAAAIRAGPVPTPTCTKVAQLVPTVIGGA